MVQYLLLLFFLAYSCCFERFLPLWSQRLNIKTLTKTESLFYEAGKLVWFLLHGNSWYMKNFVVEWEAVLHPRRGEESDKLCLVSGWQYYSCRASDSLEFPQVCDCSCFSWLPQACAL